MNKKQDWKNPKVDIRKSSIEGLGLFAKTNINLGEKIIIWRGNYTNAFQAKKMKNEGKLVMQWDDDLYSVEDRGSDKGYFINHSCNPNVWMLDAYTLVTNRPIKTGEELTVDYALFEADENYISTWQCKCGSPSCRGKVTGKDWKLPKLQKKYEGHFSPLINKRIKKMKNEA
ncbi:SET domain-containing protein [Candidatus Beckwithbacteria bacterium]|nr:SET domain-containing protein [Candidatus Beckwithbacteria bacterium]